MIHFCLKIIIKTPNNSFVCWINDKGNLVYIQGGDSYNLETLEMDASLKELPKVYKNIILD